MYYLRSRYYRSELGRFVNVDAIIRNNLFSYCMNNPIIHDDQDGTLWKLALLITTLVAGVAALSSCSSYSGYGSAPEYREIKGTDDGTGPNCYAASMGLPDSLNPGDISGRHPTDYSDVYDVYLSVKEDVEASGKTIRIIEGPYGSIQQNERRVALQVGTHLFYTINSEGQIVCGYDYHFMYQTNTGAWVEKHGTGGDSIRHEVGETPDDLSWDLGNIRNYYDSGIIYYAIGE